MKNCSFKTNRYCAVSCTPFEFRFNMPIYKITTLELWYKKERERQQCNFAAEGQGDALVEWIFWNITELLVLK